MDNIGNISRLSGKIKNIGEKVVKEKIKEVKKSSNNSINLIDNF